MKRIPRSARGTGSVGPIRSFSSAGEPDCTLASTSRLVFNVLFVDTRLKANFSLLSRQLWHGEKVFVPRFTASMLSHLEIPAIYDDNMQWKRNFFPSKRCAFKAAHCALDQPTQRNTYAFTKCLKNLDYCRASFFNRSACSRKTFNKFVNIISPIWYWKICWNCSSVQNMSTTPFLWVILQNDR